MKISDETLSKIHDLSIVTVAEKLGMKLYGTGNEGRRACCPYHEDQHPSLHFSTKRGCFKCFVCGAKGDAIKLVQDQESLSFTEACDWLIKEFNITNTDLPDPTDAFSNSLARALLACYQRDARILDKNLSVRSVSSVFDKKQPSVCDSSGSSRAVPSSIIPLPSSLVDRSLSVDSQFCRSLVSNGYLTTSQMQSAASRYRLGATKEGGVIFWEIDAQNRVHTGKIMYYQSDCHRDKTHTPTWVHALIKEELPQDYELQHCLFGLHLINTHPDPLMGRGYLSERATGGAVKPPHIAIVESEKTAVIMSEIIPEFIWLSCGGLQMFKPELLSPLTDHKVILFPDTDESGEAFTTWTQIAQQANKLYPFKHPLRISNLLESAASLDQKQRKIDIVDFLFEL